MATKPNAKSKPTAKKATRPSKPIAKKAAPKKASKPVAKKAAKPVAKPKAAAKPAAKTAAKGPANSMSRSKFVAKPIGTKSRPAISPKKGKSYGPRKNKAEKSKLPERAADIPVRTVKVQQPKVKVSKQDPNKTRYSDAELMEFKALIDEKLEAARQELRYLQDQINRKDDNGTDDTENKFANLEDGSVTMEREYLNQMASRQAQYIDHLEKALMRIQNKTYGICRVTGKLIDKERLRAVPHATLSMEAKLMQNR